MILLISYGTMMILSTIIGKEASPFQNKIFVAHLLNITIGLAFFLILSQIDYHYYYHLSLPIFIVTILLLSLVPVLGFISRGSSRWFDLGIFTLQPSELAKIFLILSLGAFLIKFRSFFRLLYFLGSLIITLVITVLVFLQPDLGTSLVSLAIWLGMYYIAGMKFWEFLFIFFSSLGSIPLIWNILKDYQKERILVFLDPQRDVLGSGYSILQSIIAIGSGQFWGLGWGRGTQSKLQFLPERHTDFIFATLSEEMGFVGVFLLMVLFLILLFSLLQILGQKKDEYGRLIIAGVFSWFIFQTLINVGMNLGIMPITGIPLPFISYGGSALVSCMMALGIVQSVVKYGE